MLTDISNQRETLTITTESQISNGKRKVEFDDNLTNKFQVKRTLESSSSSPIGSSSPFAFNDTRFNAYDCSSSPGPLSQSHLSKLSNSSSSPQHTPATTSVIAPSSPFYKNLDATENQNNNNKQQQQRKIKKQQEIKLINASEESLTLRLERGTTLQFGRKAKKMSKLDPSTIKGTTIAILLPASAKNASRIHSTVKLSETSKSLKVEIKVLGQNGMNVDGKLWKVGKVGRIKCVAGRKLNLDFWGWSSTIIVGESEQEDLVHQLHSQRESSPIDSLFDGSSSVAEHQHQQSDGDLFDSINPNPISSPEPSLSSRSREPSPIYSELSDLSDTPSSPVLGASSLELDATPAGQLARTMDLPGLIASAIVFHPRSTVGVEEVVKALLREAGNMWDVLDGGKRDESVEREDLAVQAWWNVIEFVLKEERFFGCIENVGLKDAAGNQLPPAYYYLPDDDPSKSRVEALEPFVKRVRASRVAGGGKRYFWRRPSIKKNR